MGFPFNYPNYGFSPTYLPQNFQNSPQIPPQTAQGCTSSPSGFSCRPVTSKLEAEAVQVDFLGPGTIMPDLGHGVIYLKRFNPNTGSSDFLSFSFDQNQTVEQENSESEISVIKKEINALREEIEEIKKTRKNRQKELETLE